MKTLTIPTNSKRATRGFEVKDTDDSARTFTGLAAAWSLDQGGDVIVKGAFKRTLLDFGRGKKGKIIPLIDTHSRGSIRAVVGKLLEGKETDDGLETTFEVIDGPDGDEAYRRVKGGYVDGLSIGYEPVTVSSPTPEQSRSGIWRFLKEVKLLEVSLVAFPMNVDARIDLSTVKSLLSRGDDLTEAERVDLLELQDHLRALLSKGTPGTPPADPVTVLAHDSPERLAVEAKVREIRLRCLTIGE